MVQLSLGCRAKGGFTGTIREGLCSPWHNLEQPIACPWQFCYLGIASDQEVVIYKWSPGGPDISASHLGIPSDQENPLLASVDQKFCQMPGILLEQWNFQRRLDLKQAPLQKHPNNSDVTLNQVCWNNFYSGGAERH